MITYRLTTRESGLLLFALGFQAAGETEDTRTDLFALAEKVSDARVGGHDSNANGEGALRCSPGEQGLIRRALDQARGQLAESASAAKSLRELATHLKTSGDAHASAGAGLEPAGVG